MSDRQVQEELTRERHVVGAAEAQDIAERVFDLSGRVVRFETEKDDTFRLDASDGRQYVLKIAHPSERRAELDFQNALMRHVARVDAGLPVPRVFADRGGCDLPAVRTRAAETRFVRLMSFIPGLPLDRATSSARQRQDIGALLARLRLATAEFSHPADGRRLAWDVSNLLTLRHLLEHIDEPRHRRWVERVLVRFEGIRPDLDLCRTQVLHNDFNTSNIVVDASDHDRIEGIIDFGDAARTAVAVDVATALVNQMPRAFDRPGRTDLFDAPRDLLRGYLAHADLTEAELRLIPFLALGRLATRALLTSWRAKLFPENSRYILRHMRAGWAHIEWFLSLSEAQTAALLEPRGQDPREDRRT